MFLFPARNLLCNYIFCQLIGAERITLDISPTMADPAAGLTLTVEFT